MKNRWLGMALLAGAAGAGCAGAQRETVVTNDGQVVQGTPPRDWRADQRYREAQVTAAQQDLAQHEQAIQAAEQERTASDRDSDAADAERVAAEADLRAAQASRSPVRIEQAQRTMADAQRRAGLDHVRSQAAQALRERAVAERDVSQRQMELAQVDAAQAQYDGLRAQKGQDAVAPDLQNVLNQRRTWLQQELQKAQEHAQVARSAQEQAAAQYQAMQQQNQTPQQGTGGSGYPQQPQQ
jgi:hypothetical protein